jgi:hypothetical protein
MKSYITCFTLAVILSCLTGAMAAEQQPSPEIKTYPLGFGDETNTLEMVRALVGEQGKVVMDMAHHRLLVIAPAEKHVQIEKVVNVATEVMALNGVPFSLGGLNEHRDFYSRFLVGVDKTGAKRTLDIVLTAQIVE